jgi:hypothetical protein
MKRYDFWLVMITVALLAGMGLLAFGGTLYTWRAEVVTPGWSGGPGYAAYTLVMDRLAAPLVAALVVVLGLCVPRRLFERQALWAVSAAMVLVGLGVAVVSGARVGAAAFLILAGALQTAALVLTLARSSSVNYLSQNIVYQVGSALLHLGFVVLVYDWAVLPDNPIHLPIFWLGTVLLMAGSALCFYREGITRAVELVTGRKSAEEA